MRKEEGWRQPADRETEERDKEQGKTSPGKKKIKDRRETETE